MSPAQEGPGVGAELPAATLPLPNALAYVIAAVEVLAVVTLPFAVTLSGASLLDAWSNFDLHTQVMSPVLGALILRARPGHRIGWLLVLAGGFDSFVVAAADYRYLSPDAGVAGLPSGNAVWDTLNFTWVLSAMCLLIVLPQLFPDGRLLSRRWRPLLWFSLMAPLPLVTLFILDPRQLELMTGFSRAFPLFGLTILLSLVPMQVRFRRSRGAERQQFKWVFYGLAISLPLGAVGFAVPGISTGEASPAVTTVPLLVIPTAIAVALLWYRLYDIDLVINKTLVFVVLAGFITAVYAGIVVGLGRLLPIDSHNLGLAIAATAFVAVAFEPVRARVQHWANRLVYGRRATPYEALAAMTAKIGDSADPDAALAEAARLLADGAGAAQAVVWVAQDGVLIPRAMAGDLKTEPAPVPLPGTDLLPMRGTDLIEAVRHEGRLVGALSLAKRPGEGISTADRRLVGELAGQAALLLANTRLRSRLRDRVDELRRSRQRMLVAQDRARHALERDLHDGAQQELVALKVKLGLARTIATREGAADLAARLADTATVADQAVETLRDVARGIYPPLLEAEGLTAALSAQARRVDLAVTVLDRGATRYPRAIEATAYFCAVEALHNAVRHARAEHVHIELDSTESTLTMMVTDDGRGFDPDTTGQGAGLTHMTDRADAAGGTLTIESRPGHGTTVTLAVPVDERVGSGV
ncbi:MAG: sensor histidine kinase [Pseudonocardiales bacterium]